MKHLKENRNTFPNWMYCKKAEIDLSKSGTGLFPGDFYMNRHVKRVILPDYTDTVPANMFCLCRENIRFHADSPIVDPKILKQHIEKELGHSIELHDISGNLVISTD